ncbi:MAG: site-2 protease family protein [Firmicutes bacterium]|nr:site-2 protease family protein [Bacillota bacterium]
MFRDFWNMLKRDRLMMILVLLFLFEGPVTEFLYGGIAGLMDWFMSTVMVLPAILIGLSLHEYAHAKAADYWGDPTPYYQGRLTVDPRAHIDPVGMFSLLFLHFGWGRPVQVDPRNFRNRRAGGITVGLAGITMNFIIALVTGLLIRLIAQFAAGFLFYSAVGKALGSVLINIVYLNIYLMLFNLLPVPPLDGYGVMGDLFNLRGKRWYQNIYFNSRYILLLIILLRVPSRLLPLPCYYIVNFIMRTLCGVGAWPNLFL